MPDAAPPATHDEFGLVKFHIIAGITWLFVGMLAGTLMGYRLSGAAAAEFLGDIAELSYGRMRMLHTHAVVFGWLSNGFLAFSYYAIPKLTGRRLWMRGLARGNAVFFQVAVVVGAIGLVTGHAEGVEYAEAPWWADIVFALSFVGAVLVNVGTILTSGVKNMYVTLWYLILGFVFTTLNFVMANTIVAHVAPGAAGASIEGLWIHNAVGLWVTPMGVAIIYYLLPVILKRPIASHKLSLLGFWTLAFFYPLGGSHHFFYSPTPWWLQVLAVPLTFTLIFVVYSVVYNFLATMKGRWKEIAKDIPLRWLTFGLINYIITCTQGPFHALLSVQQVIHFTDWVVAHAHLALFGVFSWWVYAFIYWIWPKLTGRAYSRAFAEWHFWLTLVSFWVLYYVADTVAGLMQGMFWLTTLPLQDSIEAALPFWATRAISGVLILAGTICFVISLARKGKPVIDDDTKQPQAQPEVAHVE
ncbi:MAG: cbb3-type cytochrome c oxidase subunit I [Planctomycetes bacterium]|nr:cbb3-type cytochrome c oxidase subunit I [Planctomycetota bacterium]